MKSPAQIVLTLVLLALICLPSSAQASLPLNFPTTAGGTSGGRTNSRRRCRSYRRRLCALEAPGAPAAIEVVRCER
jgi:hypothetical protein